MSRLADEIRELVADPSVSDHYGRWGILHPTQRKMIRKLCDICDVFEQEADRANMEIERLQKNNTEMARRQYTDGIKAFAEKLCEGRVSHDPVAIAAKCLLKEMTEESAIATAEKCIDAFKKDHNTEHLVDAANYLMSRYMYPIPGDGFRTTDSNESVHPVGTPINMEKEW